MLGKERKNGQNKKNKENRKRKSKEIEESKGRAPKIAIANRRDFLSQTSPSHQSNRSGDAFFIRKIAKRTAIACDFSFARKIARLSRGKTFLGPQESLRFLHLRLKIAIEIAEKSLTLGALRNPKNRNEGAKTGVPGSQKPERGYKARNNNTKIGTRA